MNNGLFGIPNIPPPGPVSVDLPGSAPRGRAAALVLATEQLAELRAMTQTLTALAARLAGNVYNETLETGTLAFDASGQIALQWRVAAGSIRVRNLSAANTVTVFAGGATGSVPTAGPGVYRVPFGQSDTIGIASRQITLYGTAGEYVSFSAYTTGNAPNGN